MGGTKFYDRRVEEKELVQVSIKVKKKDEELIKSIFRNLRDEKKDQTELVYLGHRATDSLIEFARELAKANRIPEPEHFYDYHISLGGWILNLIVHLDSRYKITKMVNEKDI